MTFLFWVIFIAVGLWCAYEYRDKLKNKPNWREIEKWANDKHDD